MPTRVRRGPGDLTAAGAVEAVAAGTISIASLLEDAWARMEEFEPQLGAVVSRLAAPATSPRGALAGVLFGVKESISVADAASETADATIVERLVESGAIPVARLSMAELGAPGGLTPGTRNPRAWDRISGGSSGGSAAAVAAGLVHVALGADAGGSIRIPASCCGVVGLKPTRGLVPLRGVESPTYSFDAVGPMGASVADVSLVLDAIAGHDPDDPSSLLPPPPGREVSPDQVRVGLPAQILRSQIDADVRATWEQAVSGLTTDGAILEEVDIPLLDEVPAVTRMLGTAEFAGTLLDLWSGQSELRPPLVQSHIDQGERLPGAAVARSYHTRVLFVARLRAVFEDVDVLVMPTLACRVPPTGADDAEVDIEVDGVREPRVSALTRFVNPWNLAGLPAGTVPAGIDDNGAPVGIQVVGPWFADEFVVDVMAQIERRAGGPLPSVPPAYHVGKTKYKNP